MENVETSELDIKRESHLLDVKKFEFEQAEARRSRLMSWFNLGTTALVGVAAAVVSCTQLDLAKNDDERKKREEAIKLADDARRGEEIAMKRKQAFDQEALTWFKAVTEQKPMVFSDDLRERCRARTLLKTLVGDSFFDRHYGALGIASSFCDKQADLDLAVQAQKDGAPLGWTRRDKATGGLLVATCAPKMENRHGRPDIEVSQVCSIPPEADKSARIYSIEYSCTDFKCGWSYNRGNGYAKDVKEADDRRSFRWWRKWDGDPAGEKYTVYYEQLAQ